MFNDKEKELLRTLVKKELDDLGVEYHHRAGPAKLVELLEDAKRNKI